MVFVLERELVACENQTVVIHLVLAHIQATKQGLAELRGEFERDLSAPPSVTPQVRESVRSSTIYIADSNTGGARAEFARSRSPQFRNVGKRTCQHR